MSNHWHCKSDISLLFVHLTYLNSFCQPSEENTKLKFQKLVKIFDIDGSIIEFNSIQTFATYKLSHLHARQTKINKNVILNVNQTSWKKVSFQLNFESLQWKFRVVQMDWVYSRQQTKRSRIHASSWFSSVGLTVTVPSVTDEHVP